MTPKIDVFYTGGGITIAEADISPTQYAVVSSEAPEFLSVYEQSNGEKNHLPEDMVASIAKDEITHELKSLYAQMLDKLKLA